MDDFKCLLWCLITQLTKGTSVFTVMVNAAPHWLRNFWHKEWVFLWSAGWLVAMILTQRSAEIKGTEERKRKGEKVWFHMQVAVKDVYLKRPISLLSPKLEMNKSSVQFTPADGLISSGDSDYRNRLCVIMSTSVFVWDFTLAFIEAERTALQVKHGSTTFSTWHH